MMAEQVDSLNWALLYFALGAEDDNYILLTIYA